VTKRRVVGLARIYKDRYLLVGLGVLVVLFTCVTVAFASYLHSTNGVYHGIWGGWDVPNPAGPQAATDPSNNNWSTAEMRHYFDDGSYWVQCRDAGYGYTSCPGTWGSAPCQKRYVGGVDGSMARHWMRDGSCSGTHHG
jgi:hypothetical protein